MKSEIDLVIESSLGSKAPISRPGAASSSDSGPAPMDVDSLTKVINSLVKGKGSGGKGKSKGKGKDKGSGGKGSTSKDIVCFNCGKAGHKAAECWSKKKDGSNKGSSKGSKGGGKKGKSKGKHKGANSLEEDTGEGAHEEEQPEGELDVGMFELGALTAGEDLQAMEWVRFNWTPVQPRQQSHQTGQTKRQSRKELRLCSRRPQVSWSVVRVCSKEPESLGTAVVSQARWLRCTNPWSRPTNA